MARPEAPPGTWPRFMRSATAAAYMDEPSVEAFLRKVGTVYPQPVAGRGRSRKWDRSHLDRFPHADDQVPSLADDL